MQGCALAMSKMVAGSARIGEALVSVYMWMAPCKQRFAGGLTISGRVRSYFWPVDAAQMSVGPDEVRKAGPNQICAHGALDTTPVVPVTGGAGDRFLRIRVMRQESSAWEETLE